VRLLDRLPSRKEFWLQVVKWTSIGFGILTAVIFAVVVFLFVVEPWLMKRSFAGFEGEKLESLIAVKGEPLRRFEGEDWQSELQKFISEGSCHPLKEIRGSGASVFPSDTVYGGWTFVVVYVDSEGRIVGVEVAGT